MDCCCYLLVLYLTALTLVDNLVFHFSLNYKVKLFIYISFFLVVNFLMQKNAVFFLSFLFYLF